MFFKQHPVEVWRLGDAPTGNWGDPQLVYVFTFYAGIQPFTADEGLHDDQMMQNVRDLIMDSNVDEDVRYGDVLKYWNTYHRVAYLNPCRSGLIDHLEIYTTDTQMDTPSG